MGAVAKDESSNASDRAAKGVETFAVCNGVAFALVFLCGEIEADGCGCF